MMSAIHDDASAPDMVIPDTGWDEAWRRAHEERAFWDAHRAEYTRSYPEQFVAIVDNKLVAHDLDLRTLLERLGSLGIDLGDVWVEYMVTSERPFLL